MNIILDKGLCFGAKIVRGAYMEKERKRAKDLGYPDPVNDNYEATGQMYNNCINHIISDLLNKSPKKHHLVVATHNEEGLSNAIGTMRENCMKNDNEKIVFGQIFGMGEQVSMPLGMLWVHFLPKLTSNCFSANAGYLVYKSVPYGPMHELMPYLSRRAAESRAILQNGVRKERELLINELFRRVFKRSN